MRTDPHFLDWKLEYKWDVRPRVTSFDFMISFFFLFFPPSFSQDLVYPTANKLLTDDGTPRLEAAAFTRNEN